MKTLWKLPDKWLEGNKEMKKKDLFSESKKNLTKTSLGKLTSLQKRRRNARNRLTRAINQLREIEDKIDELCKSLAEKNLEMEWEEIYKD